LPIRMPVSGFHSPRRITYLKPEISGQFPG
jgi:hypothetical protein